MLYDIVLKNGQEIEAWARGVQPVLDMFMSHDIFVIAENEYPDKVTYVLASDVSYIRFPKDYSDVDEPVS